MTKPLSIWGEKPLKSALEQLMRPMLSERDRLLFTLTTEWRMIVGEDVAATTSPRHLQITRTERVLTLAVRSGMQTLVAHQLPEIMARIAQFIGPGKITRLKVQSHLRNAKNKV